MSYELLRKPPVGNPKTDRFKISLLGNHSTKQKLAMLLQAKFFLHEHGIDHAGLTDVYIPLIDAHGHPLAFFPDGTPIDDYHLVIKSPYHCAADEYDERPQRPSMFAL